MINNLQVIVVHDEYTLYNARYQGDALAVDTVAGGLGALLNALPEGRGEVVVVLAGDAPDWFGVPMERPTDKAPLTDGPTLQQLRGAGWTVSDLRAWTTCRKPGIRPSAPDLVPAVHVAVADWLDADDFPLLAGSWQETAERLVSWHQKTGVAWRGNPGVAGTALLRAPGMVPLTNGLREPRFMLRDDQVDRAWRNAELAYLPKMFTGHADGRYRYKVDARKAYLAAWQSCLFAADVLKPGPTEFDKSLAGWWYVELDPWQHADLPDPAGYRPNGRPLSKRWLTTPTVQLLDDLERAGRHTGFRVIESRVNKGTQVLRKTADVLKDLLWSPTSLPYLQDTAKAVYARTGGMLARPGGRIYRPDWQAAIVAHCRANQWRKLSAAVAAGWVPIEIDTDAITFAGDSPQIPADLRALFPTGETLGRWRYYDVEDTRAS